LKENRVVGYEYVNEKARKEWWGTYEDGEIMWNLEYWPERYIKEYSTQNMCNYRPQYKKYCSCMLSYLIALITNLLSSSFVLI
jgi:hypothetical protein